MLFFFNDTATTEIYTLSLHDALPIFAHGSTPPDLADQVTEHLTALEKAMGKTLGDPADPLLVSVRSGAAASMPGMMETVLNVRSEEHTSELQSRQYLVCRLLLEKKKI